MGRWSRYRSYQRRRYDYDEDEDDDEEEEEEEEEVISPPKRRTRHSAPEPEPEPIALEPLGVTEIAAKLDGGRLPGLTYDLIMEGASNFNGVRGTPEPSYEYNRERCTSIALMLVWAGKRRYSSFLHGLGKDVVLLIAKRIFNTRNEMIWAIERDSDDNPLVATLLWTCEGSNGGSYDVEVNINAFPIASLDDIDVCCDCPSADDLGNLSTNFCKHVRDCLVTVEDREKSAPPRPRPEWIPWEGRSYYGRKYRGYW